MTARRFSRNYRNSFEVDEGRVFFVTSPMLIPERNESAGIFVAFYSKAERLSKPHDGVIYIFIYNSLENLKIRDERELWRLIPYLTSGIILPTSVLKN